MKKAFRAIVFIVTFLIISLSFYYANYSHTIIFNDSSPSSELVTIRYSEKVIDNIYQETAHSSTGIPLQKLAKKYNIRYECCRDMQTFSNDRYLSYILLFSKSGRKLAVFFDKETEITVAASMVANGYVSKDTIQKWLDSGPLPVKNAFDVIEQYGGALLATGNYSDIFYLPVADGGYYIDVSPYNYVRQYSYYSDSELFELSCEVNSIRLGPILPMDKAALYE